MKFKKEINWIPTLFLSIYQILLVISLPFYFYYNTPSISLLLVSLALLYAAGLSITAGYHRYYAHRSYKTNSFVEFFLLFFGSMATQGSALRWAFDHRIHHAHVDTDNDPYNINRGFLYAHFTWIIDKPKEIESKIVPDLLKNKLVMFQHRHIGKLIVLSNLIAFLAVGYFLNDYLGAFVISLWLRMFALHHFTWFINSLAHVWGDKPFSQEQTAVDNYFLAMLTFGEGYHNFHHTFANDYRNGIRWYQFDPTKWLIWSLSKLGLVHNLKRVDQATINKRMVIEQKNFLLDHLKEAWYSKKSELEREIHQISDRLLEKIQQFNELKNQYSQIKQESGPKDLILELKQEIKNLKKSLKQDFDNMRKLTTLVLNHSAS